MIDTKQLIDNKTNYSTTRWAFVTILKFDMVIIVSALLAYFVCVILDINISESVLYAVGTLLGSLTGIITLAKGAQGFETKHIDTEISKSKKENHHHLKKDNDDCNCDGK